MADHPNHVTRTHTCGLGERHQKQNLVVETDHFGLNPVTMATDHLATCPQRRHHAARFHPAGEHVPVVAIGRDDLVTLAGCHLHADNDRFLADIEVAEAADEAHAVKLAGLLLETPDQQHVPVELHQPHDSCPIHRPLARLGL